MDRPPGVSMATAAEHITDNLGDSGVAEVSDPPASSNHPRVQLGGTQGPVGGTQGPVGVPIWN